MKEVLDYSPDYVGSLSEREIETAIWYARAKQAAAAKFRPQAESEEGGGEAVELTEDAQKLLDEELKRKFPGVKIG